MSRTWLTVAIMVLAPPVLLLSLAHLGAFISHSALVGYSALVAAWLLGIAALATSRWPRRTKVWVGVAYTLAAIPLIPFLGLLAVCSTGDCI